MSISNTKVSRFLSLVLRHKPEVADIKLDGNGWTDIDGLIEGANRVGKPFDRAQLELVVQDSDKQRFIISGNRIRANQGHSVEIDLNLKQAVPPDELFHGTVRKFVEAIMKDGLKKMNRHHVHLSSDLATAEKVGSRRGPPVILRIDSASMAKDGHFFMCSDNGVWLTDSVPSRYISTLDR